LAKKILEERVGDFSYQIFDFSTIYREKRAIKVGKRADFGPGSTIFSDEHRLYLLTERRAELRRWTTLPVRTMSYEG